MADAVGATPAYLATAASAMQASNEGQFGSLGQGRRNLSRGVKASGERAEAGSGDGDDRAAQQRAGG
jgi:hypothetical protein